MRVSAIGSLSRNWRVGRQPLKSMAPPGFARPVGGDQLRFHLPRGTGLHTRKRLTVDRAPSGSELSSPLCCRCSRVAAPRPPALSPYPSNRLFHHCTVFGQFPCPAESGTLLFW